LSDRTIDSIESSKRSDRERAVKSNSAFGTAIADPYKIPMEKGDLRSKSCQLILERKGKNSSGDPGKRDLWREANVHQRKNTPRSVHGKSGKPGKVDLGKPHFQKHACQLKNVDNWGRDTTLTGQGKIRSKGSGNVIFNPRKDERNRNGVIRVSLTSQNGEQDRFRCSLGET